MSSLRSATAALFAAGALMASLAACNGGSDNGAAADKSKASSVASAPAKESKGSSMAPATSRPKAGAVCALVNPDVVEKKIGVPVSDFNDYNMESSKSSNQVSDPNVCNYILRNGDTLIVNRFPNTAQARAELSTAKAVKIRGDRKFYASGNGMYIVLVGDTTFIQVQSLTLRDATAAPVVDYAIGQLTT